MNSEHERYLAEKVFKGPVIVYNHPKEFKAFYMLLNEDGKTVASMDVLVPGVIISNFLKQLGWRIDWRSSERAQIGSFGSKD